MDENEEQSSTESASGKKDFLRSKETSQRLIRVITVIAYLFSVSMAAVVLSLYYLFFWSPTVQSRPQKLVDPIQLHLSRFYFNLTQKGQFGVGSISKN